MSGNDTLLRVSVGELRLFLRMLFMMAVILYPFSVPLCFLCFQARKLFLGKMVTVISLG